jgi:hypothetical protein
MEVSGKRHTPPLSLPRCGRVNEGGNLYMSWELNTGSPAHTLLLILLAEWSSFLSFSVGSWNFVDKIIQSKFYNLNFP